MDWQKYCIIDNTDNRDITEKVTSISKDESISRYCITFENNPTVFHYSFSRITFLSKPQELNTQNQLIFINGKLQPEIKKILCFGTWCKVLYFDDVKSTVPFNAIQLVKDIRKEPKTSSIIDYLIEIARIDGPRTSQSNDEPGFLYSQLKTLQIREDSILKSIIKKEALKYMESKTPIIAPFSSNESQLNAIRKALESRLSLIQGPPGTGKTQTILNIISNLLIRGKTIAVVSGNNEATRNVYEKLEKEHLGSICALLGNRSNVEHFFNSQPQKKELEAVLSQTNISVSENKLSQLATKVSKIYESNREIAEIEAQIEYLQPKAPVLSERAPMPVSS